MGDDGFVHPYIPNSVPEVKREMLLEIGARDAQELYAEMIPNRLLLKDPLNLPDPLLSELDLRRHVEGILAKNRTCADHLSFLGAGCWHHYVPAVCLEIMGRSEFLTAYAGGPYSDLGRYQAIFEFQSMIGELLGMEVSGLPTYDWASARRSVIENYAQPNQMPGHIVIEEVDYDPETGGLDLEDLEMKIDEETAGVYVESPSYLGVVETGLREIGNVAHDHGAEFIVGVDPITLGVLAPPADYGADIACGDIQPLGIPMFAGGGLGGFIASRDEERYVGEYPLRLISITVNDEGEYGFGQCTFDRTSYIGRDKAKDWIGTSTALWAIGAGVYMALMGPRGMREVGEAILRKSHYAARLVSELDGVSVPFGGFFKEFIVNFDAAGREVATVNEALLGRGIFGGKDISSEFPELGQSALYCVTEMHTKEELKSLIVSLEEVLN
jgi:glycine dehydrogenase subunit 1